MGTNAAGLDVAGANNPNWQGGSLDRTCCQCGAQYRVKRANAGSRFCSLQCVGLSQRGQVKPSRKVEKQCVVCGAAFSMFPAHADRQHCCSRACSHKRRAALNAGDANPNWTGGLSRMPYPWNFRDISRSIIERDGGRCQNPDCRGEDPRMTAHHINYDKQDCAPSNLIALCSSCNSRANFGRDRWTSFYTALLAGRVAA